jgi:two-component system phosphate regulon response regulator PhoB
MRRVRRSSRELRLGKQLVMLLACLMHEPGRVYSREQLRDLVWGPGARIAIRTIDTQIGRLRKALGGEGDGNPIKTARNAGYTFVAGSHKPRERSASRS